MLHVKTVLKYFHEFHKSILNRPIKIHRANQRRSHYKGYNPCQRYHQHQVAIENILVMWSIKELMIVKKIKTNYSLFNAQIRCSSSPRKYSCNSSVQLAFWIRFSCIISGHSAIVLFRLNKSSISVINVIFFSGTFSTWHKLLATHSTSTTSHVAPRILVRFVPALSVLN